MIDTTRTDSRAEEEFLKLVNTKEAWSLIERFSTLVRESGTEDEFTAARYIVERLKALGVPVQVHEPSLYISLPRGAAVELEDGRETITLRAKTPAFSVSTGAEGCRGTLVHLASDAVKDVDDLFVSHIRNIRAHNLRHRVVVTEGFPMPTTVRTLEKQGARAVIFVHPGQNIHEMICTTIWGNPTPENLHRKPGIPVASVNQSDGQDLIGYARGESVDVTVRTELEERWRPCALPVVTIEGSVEPEKFLLVHGHYDSWHVGIGDNATGDAALLELARIFHSRRDLLRRSIRIAWWPGHSTGRYAGSTWFSDNFAMDIRRNCIGQVDIDSPGCRGATAFEEVMWMSECGALCRGAIRDRTGLEATRLKPLRAGDYSFNQIGLSSFFMLLSNRPKEERKKLGFYPVGGCGGDIAWHTEDDTLDVASRDILEQDLGIYVSAIVRCVNSEILPWDFRETLKEFRSDLESCEAIAEGFSLTEVFEQLEVLEQALELFYDQISGGKWDHRQKEANELMLEMGRKLVPLLYSRGEAFDHDPAEQLGVIPKLAGARQLPGLEKGSAERRFLENGLVRQRNKVANTLLEASELVRLYRS